MSTSSSMKDDLVKLIPNLRAFALGLVKKKHLADDLVQEAICKACAKFHTFEEGTNLKAWIFTILRNEFYSQCRKKKFEVEDTDGNHAAKLTTKASQESHIELNEVRKCINELPVEQREVLLLIGVEGMSYREVADFLDIPIGTAKSRVCRARTALTTKLSQNELATA